MKRDVIPFENEKKQETGSEQSQGCENNNPTVEHQGAIFPSPEFFEPLGKIHGRDVPDSSGDNEKHQGDQNDGITPVSDHTVAEKAETGIAKCGHRMENGQPQSFEDRVILQKPDEQNQRSEQFKCDSKLNGSLQQPGGSDLSQAIQGFMQKDGAVNVHLATDR
jgi:hypothetical protein